MSTELERSDQENNHQNVNVNAVSSDAVYGIGVIGAWVYFIGKGETPRDKLRGFFKGIVWPAFLVYELFKFLDKE